MRSARLRHVVPFALLAGGAPAGGVAISDVSVSNFDERNYEILPFRARRWDMDVLASTGTTLDTRYAATGVADVGPGGSYGIVHGIDYFIQFSVTADPGETYRIDLLQHLVGGLTAFDDHGGVGARGTARVSDVYGTYTGPGQLVGRLPLYLPSAASIPGNPTGYAMLNVDVAKAAVLYAVGTGAPQVHRFRFSGEFELLSFSGFPLGGDEVTYRFGAAGFDDAEPSLAGVAIDDYPGPPEAARTQESDGHFVSLRVVPEPDTLLLALLGLAGLGVARRPS